MQPVARLVLAVLVIVGGALRLWSGAIATIHDDELHYAADAGWARSPLGASARAAAITIDDRPVAPDELRVEGWVHRLRLALPAGGILRAVWVRPRAGSP